MKKKLSQLRIQYRVSGVGFGKELFFRSASVRALQTLPELQHIILPFRPDMIEASLKRLTHLRRRRPAIETAVSEEVVLLRGGAYLNDIWGDYWIIDAITSAVSHSRTRMIMIAPHSFCFCKTDFREVIADIEQELHIFCRERTSYDLMCSTHFPANVHVHLSQDAALYLTDGDFEVKKSGREEYVLVAPRLDRESIVRWNLRRAQKLWKETRILVRDMSLCDLTSFVNIVGNASEVHTDRLHVGILSAILGKQTYLYPNCYHKNKGVYEFSLRQFPKMKFVESREFPPSEEIRD